MQDKKVWLRVTAEQHEEWKRAAKQCGQTFAKWAATMIEVGKRKSESEQQAFDSWQKQKDRI